ncbi:3-hydroxyacyl-CoA dehydrogenase [Amylibacter sp. SFDW26]|uniref:3-hydroxyacyl-CoA dehydrogenase NAD-binding domain-containing protein n=1 Tax=Amylibacter sp. SFDW26 TaxID=2652722 RepID=UPI00126205FC|nr:3-hydroxyacyl-CoA dehydrogenase NAD-binding domain-containing protein [Amylibacter sp. SFDW26]KAB7615939.1 3-hydroxyacyl-CoA dehydrogenase [Amylibacter sp. SFDW26]
MADFQYDVDADGIATITWDVPNKSMNVLNIEASQELEALVDKVLADDAVKGAVITSGKADFAGGMDLNVIAKMKEMAGDNPAKGLFDGIMGFHQMTRKIERAGMDAKTNKGGKPIAAALPGTALGIGFEIPLACHRIFAADNPKAKIGLPEILVGIFPGAGGTTRISRKLDMMTGSPVLMNGKLSDPQAAKRLGLIDEVVPADELLSSAKEWVKNATDADIVKPWDQKGFKMPGGAPYHPAGFMNYVGASAMIHGKTQGVYPAARAMLSAIYEGAQVPFDTAIKIEARWFTNVLMNPSSSAMIKTIFTNKTALEKGAVRPEGVADMSVKKVGVMGAGMMGAGIAFVSAKVGIDVVLVDRDQEACDRGLASVTDILDQGIKRKKVTEEKKAEILSHINATPDYDALKGCDLIVEAVFEDPAIKATVTKAVEEQLEPSAIFATNTSTLPITELAKASRDDTRFIGIHFFSPVHKMNLVEIIKGANTGPEAVAKALDFVRQIKKTPIVVNDERFFYANRCILPYVNEGITMLAEGVEPALIENAAKLLGMPLGPLQLADEVSIDLSVKIVKATQAALGDDYKGTNAEEILFKLFDEDRMGRKNGAGFYAYDEKGKRTGIWEGLRENWPVSDEQPDLAQVQHRLAMQQVLEAVRSFEDGVLEDIREGDVGAILGWGFMPWSGGPFSWLDIIGADKAVEICDDLTEKFGERFTTPALLRELSKNGETFYGRFGPEAKADAA